MINNNNNVGVNNKLLLYRPTDHLVVDVGCI